jgi:inner membrane protein involved in colicin E2 resistance
MNASTLISLLIILIVPISLLIAGICVLCADIRRDTEHQAAEDAGESTR